MGIEVYIVLFAMLCLLMFNNEFQGFRTRYKCGICNTDDPDKHADDCPWKAPRA